jgi:D-glycero-D-manno-heptose 1,7-bisphosphate phosphatase
MKLLILGRDGILNRFRNDHVKLPEEWQPIPGAMEALARLNHAGWHAVVATNQGGIGSGMIEMAQLNAVHAHMMKQAQAAGARIDAVFFCPHTPEEDCDCRKPKPGLMLDIAERYKVALAQVLMLADTGRDLLAAQAAGCEPHLLLSGRAANLNESELAGMLAPVPGTRVHSSFGAFADWLLQRDEQPDSQAAPLPKH